MRVRRFWWAFALGPFVSVEPGAAQLIPVGSAANTVQAVTGTASGAVGTAAQSVSAMLPGTAGGAMLPSLLPAQTGATVVSGFPVSAVTGVPVLAPVASGALTSPLLAGVPVTPVLGPVLAPVPVSVVAAPTVNQNPLLMPSTGEPAPGVISNARKIARTQESLRVDGHLPKTDGADIARRVNAPAVRAMYLNGLQTGVSPNHHVLANDSEITRNQVRSMLVTRGSQILSSELNLEGGACVLAAAGTRLSGKSGVVILHAGSIHADTSSVPTTIIAGRTHVDLEAQSAVVVKRSSGSIVVQATAGGGAAPVKVIVDGNTLALTAGQEVTIADKNLASDDLIDVNGTSSPISAGITRCEQKHSDVRSFNVHRFLEDELLGALNGGVGRDRKGAERMVSHVLATATKQKPDYVLPQGMPGLLQGSVKSGAAVMDILCEPGSVYSQVQGHTINLESGKFVCRVPQRFLFNIGCGSVQAERNALLAIEMRAGQTRIWSLSGPGDLFFQQDGRLPVAIHPAEELLISRTPLTSVACADGIGRRNVRTVNLDGGYAALIDFSMPSMMRNYDCLHDFAAGDADVLGRMLKTAAAVNLVTQGRGQYICVPKAESSLMVAKQSD